ncbi:hypothetical protein PODOV060v1_p0023 [Vibrio phage 234P8]|nr:hypothetical protein PODOV060v1_p0023 [Vibrio phage 234P8]
MNSVFKKFKVADRKMTPEEIELWKSKPCVCGDKSNYKLTISGDDRDLRLCKKHHANLCSRTQTITGVDRVESIHYNNLNFSMFYLKPKTFNHFNQM